MCAMAVEAQELFTLDAGLHLLFLIQTFALIAHTVIRKGFQKAIKN